MKREFGKKLIEEFFPRRGPHPRHRHHRRLHPGPRDADGHPVRAEPAAGGRDGAHGDGHQGRAGDAGRSGAGQGLDGDRSIRSTEPGARASSSAWPDTDATTFATHPWSIGGGGAAELKEADRSSAERRLERIIECIGFASHHRADDAFVMPTASVTGRKFKPKHSSRIVCGEIRARLGIGSRPTSSFPYEAEVIDPTEHWLDAHASLGVAGPNLLRQRRCSESRPMRDEGRPWCE